MSKTKNLNQSLFFMYDWLNYLRFKENECYTHADIMSFHVSEVYFPYLMKLFMTPNIE